MRQYARYRDVVEEVCAELAVRVEELTVRGVRAERIVLDPGLGFAKRPEHDWALLAGLDRLTALGFPMLVGASRKSFLGATLSTGSAPGPEPAGRDAATTAVSAPAAAAGAWGVRVHDVPGNRDAVRVAAAGRAGAAVRVGAGA